MLKIRFSTESARLALIAAEAALHAADVIGVWVDRSGSGWTGTYRIIIDTAQKHGRNAVIQNGHRSGQTVWVTEIAPTAKTAVSEALSGLEIGEHMMLSYEPREHYQTGERLWPIRHLIADLRQRIAGLQAEIDRLSILVENVI
jgi:hypothetical protein